MNNDDVDRQSIGQTSKGSGAVNRLPKKKTIKKEKTVEEVINYAERTYTVKPSNQDSEDEEFTAKLEELRVEVTKRDIQRKFEAMQNAPKGKFNRGAGIQPGTTLLQGSPTNGLTTDHNGNLLQLKSGAPHMLLPTQTSVTVSRDLQVVKGERLKALAKHVSSMSRDSQASIYDPDQSISNAKQSSMQRRSSIAKVESTKSIKGNRTSMSTGMDQAGTTNDFVNPDDILNHTTSSNFEKLRKETGKLFNQMQTRDYERSI